MKTYSLYPSLLDSYHTYLAETGYMKDGELVLFMPDEQAVLDRINRVYQPKTPAQHSGQNFEDYVLKRKPLPQSPIVPQILEAQKFVPPFGFAGAGCIGCYEFPGYNVVMYGYMDFVGAGHIIDIKETRFYSPGKFYDSHQLFYLKNMQALGVNKMTYVVHHNSSIQTESYTPALVNWGNLFAEVQSFIEFLEQYRELITDQKIFTDVRYSNWQSRPFGYDQPNQQAQIV